MGEAVSKVSSVPHLKKGQVFHVKALRPDRVKVDLTMEHFKELGRGAFGVVNKMKVTPLGEPSLMTAVKIPEQEDELAIVELYVLLKLNHANVARLLYYFSGVKGMPKSIIIVLELVEGGDLFHFLKRNFSKIRGIGMMFEVFSYQLFRGLAYCHSRKICHRDIKPENLLVNPDTGVLKITDFGCGAEMKNPADEHTFYIGTRIFRSPELLLGATHYDFTVDVWAGGVVMSEMVLGIPLFYGREGQRGQLLSIFEYLGVPKDSDFRAMGADPIPLPKRVAQKSIGQKFKMHGVHHEKLLLKLLEQIFVYSPAQRLTAWEVCASDFFTSLRKYDKLPNGQPLPKLFNFSHFEFNSMTTHVQRRFATARAMQRQ